VQLCSFRLYFLAFSVHLIVSVSTFSDKIVSRLFNLVSLLIDCLCRLFFHRQTWPITLYCQHSYFKPLSNCNSDHDLHCIHGVLSFQTTHINAVWAITSPANYHLSFDLIILELFLFQHTRNLLYFTNLCTCTLVQRRTVLETQCCY